MKAVPPAMPAASPRVISVQEIEAELRRLRGIVAARVVCGSAGDITEIHAVAEPGRTAKMVVRDIESVLLARWNLQPHRNKISVAQRDGKGGRAAAALSGPRLRVVSANVTTSGDNELGACVVLQAGDGGAFVGEAVGRNGDERAALLARATLRAVENGFGHDEGRLRLRALAPVTLDNRRALTLLVALSGGKHDDLLTGSALIRGDTPEAADRAAVAATLDAVNRRLASLDAPRGVSSPDAR